MNVQVMSRSEAMRYCHKMNNTPVIMISISDPFTEYPRAPFSTRQNLVADIERLWFTDDDRPCDGAELITEADAVQIKRILKRFPHLDVIVHCDAGTSRSAGVAAAILKAYTGDDSQIFDNPKYKPNMLCYRTVLNELMKEAEEKK